ncbi:MAG TPA: hypothetical protein VJH03_13125 [Blastocatellia bacterium]|nr:hypothetical protein [Blastocatellia bacterium]
MKTKVVITVLAAAVLSGAAYWFVMWNLGRSFGKVDWKGLQDLFEASLGETVTGGEAAEPGPGAIPYYQEHPGELESDKRHFETWRSALVIASAAQEHERSIQDWTASTNIQWIAPSDRTDGWGHAFCVWSNARLTVVVSPGPRALGSFDCGTLDIPEKDLATMASGRLNVQASGALVLVLVQRNSRPSG